MGDALKYFITGVIFWVAVDFATTQGIVSPYAYYSVHFPAILIFYIGYPLVFSFLIFRKNLKGKGLFAATIIAMLIVEVLFTRNAAIFSFPLLLIGIPAAVAIYSFITIVPKWIAEGTIKKNSGKTLILLFSVITVVILNLLGS